MDRLPVHSVSLPQSIDGLIQHLQSDRGKVFIFCITQHNVACAVSTLLQEHGITVSFATNWQEVHNAAAGTVLISSIFASAHWCFDNKVFISDKSTFERILAVGANKVGKFHEKLLSASTFDLQEGQLVMHRQYGIGMFMGFQLITVADVTREFAKLHYANNDKVYIPVEHLDQIKLYLGGDDGDVKLDNLKSQAWQKKCNRSKDKIKAVAARIIDLAARRQASDAHIYSLDARRALMDQMIALFPFTATEDQEKSLEQIYADLSSGKPMDRLICGDVGFGKTEVALRALFLVVCGKLNGCNYGQAALLCPTTYLARQHYQNICNRLASFDINIAQLSRATSTAEAKSIKAKLVNGEIDVVVATHSIFGADVGFKKLDLIICDEEQLFGVNQKEQLKKTFPTAHCLALSATPIPRTLEVALHGIRDVSTIMTPPPERVLIKGEVITFNAADIIDIVNRERRHRGCVICVTPRIACIQPLLDFMLSIMPNLKVTSLHGKMAADTVEKILIELHSGVYDMVIATTVIAVGMDFANSNTVIIHHAEMFGLAQLYQIRGRVGRRNQQAYCYFLLEEQVMRDHSKLHYLDTLRSIKSLGSGLSLAYMDLKLRGGGNILGEEQSGVMTDIGPDLYYQMLEEAIQQLQLTSQIEHFVPEVDIGTSIYIPQDYIPDPVKRVDIYRKVASITDLVSLEQLRLQLVESFGFIPPSMDALFKVIQIRYYCMERKIAAATITGRRVVIKPLSGQFIDADKLLALLDSEKNITLKANNTIVVNIPQVELNTLEPVPLFLHAFSKLKVAWL